MFLATNNQEFGQSHTRQLQESDDITLIVNMVTVGDAGHRAMALAIATAFNNERRVPKTILDAVAAYVQQKDTLSESDQANAVTEQISDATYQSTQAVLANVRVYIQYQQPADKGRIESIRQNLNGQTVDGKTVIVPPTERVIISISKPVLKCFRIKECSQFGDALVKALKDSGAPPSLTLEPIPGYENSTKMRPGHFELWLGPLQ